MSKRKFEEINAEQTTNSEKSMAASNSSSSLELSNDQDEESIDVQEPDSTPSFSLQKTRTNFCRLCQLFVTICGDVFRAILSYHIKPINLRTELDNNKTKIEKVLNMEQRNILYPATGGHNISSRELDLSLVYILLRNICNIPSHQKGWGKEPESSDNSLAARIDRLRIKRNSIAHHKNGQIEDNEFEFIWDVIRSNVIEIEKLYLGTSTFEWIIDDLYSRDIDPLKANKYVKEFRLLEDRLIEVEGKMSTVSEELVVKQETMGVHSECITQLGHNRAVDKAQMDHLSSVVSDLKAQIDRIEAHQSSDAKDIKGTLKGVRGRIDDIEEGQSIDTKDTKDKLTRMGKNITDMTEEDELDLTIKLNEDSIETDLELQDEIEPSIRDIRKIMQDRQELAKKKESLKYALRTNITPAWLTLKLQCHPNLQNQDDNEDFKQFWKDTATLERHKLLKNLTSYFENGIEKKNKEINNVRSKTFQKLGCKTKVSADVKREFDRLIQVAQIEHTKALEHFRDNLNSGQSSSSRDTPKQETANYRRSRGNNTFRGMRRRNHKPY